MAATKRRLRTLRIGVIGGQAPGFFAMSADPFSIQQSLGAQVQTFSLVEFAIAVTEKRWVNALDIGQHIIVDFPNSKMSEEIRGKLDVLKQNVQMQNN